MHHKLTPKLLAVGACIALAVTLLTLTALLAAESLSTEAGTAFALVFMVLFYFVSLPLHAGLLLATAQYASSRGLQGIGAVCFYLLLAVACHAAIGVWIGAFDKLEREVSAYQLERSEPAQVALERAIQRSSASADVRAALAAGANPDAILPGGPLTALLVAASRADVGVVVELLQGGADPNLGAAIDMGLAILETTPVDAAAFSEGPQRVQLVEQLLAAGAKLSSSYAVLGACARGDASLYRLVVDNGGLDRPNTKGERCLHVAAKGGHTEVVRAALADEANPNELNRAQHSPLRIALARGHFDAALAIARAGGKTSDTKLLDKTIQSEISSPEQAAFVDWYRSAAR